MSREKRREYILHKLEEENQVRVADLKEELGLSEATVRKTLEQMEGEGLLKRTWGGAVPAAGVASEIAYRDKTTHRIEQKRAIARAAYEMIADGETVFLDSGTTTGQLAKLIARGKKRKITVCTNAVNVLTELGKAEDIRVIMIGGEFRHSIFSCVGPISTAVMEGLAFDKAFLSGSHFTAERGFSTPELREGETKKAALKSARQRIVLMDSEKFGQDSMVIIAGTKEVSCLVTDWELKEMNVKELEACGIEVVRAEKEG